MAPSVKRQIKRGKTSKTCVLYNSHIRTKLSSPHQSHLSARGPAVTEQELDKWQQINEASGADPAGCFCSVDIDRLFFSPASWRTCCNVASFSRSSQSIVTKKARKQTERWCWFIYFVILNISQHFLPPHACYWSCFCLNNYPCTYKRASSFSCVSFYTSVKKCITLLWTLGGVYL